ncbi:MAG: hypothetical protein HOG49_33360 [Candidatus Scalindua sp.]|jgi:hypothetical protein|nr:hypothetical protein [Candidatus Scalindua sp.]
MIVKNKSDQEFLKAFAKSNEWNILKTRFILPLINEVENVNGGFKFDEEYLAGEKYAGREIASKFGKGIIKVVEMFNNRTTKPKKLEDNFE